MSDKTDPFEGFYEKFRSVDVSKLMGSLPVGLVSLSALRSTQRELAKSIFRETYISPLRTLLRSRETEESRASVDEIETRFAQDDLLHLGQDIEFLASAHLLHCRYQELHSKSGVPILSEEGNLTYHGNVMFEAMVTGVVGDTSTFMISCERRVTLLLTAALAGGEALDEQLAFHREGYREAYMASIEHMLRMNRLKGTYLKQAMNLIATRSDEDIFKVWCGFQGFWSNSRKHAEHLLRELLGVPEDIEF